MKKRLLYVVLMLVSNLLFAQNGLKSGYLITNQQDTIKGKGIMNMGQKSCLFQIDKMTKPVNYKPNEVVGVHFDGGGYFISKELVSQIRIHRLFKEDKIIEKHQWYFLEFLLDGEVDLFVIRSGWGNRFFIDKADEPMLELLYQKNKIISENGKEYTYKNRRYLGLLKAYMEDSPKTCAKIDKIDILTQKNMINLAEEYHHDVCHDYDCINYAKSLPKHRFKIKLKK